MSSKEAIGPRNPAPQSEVIVHVDSQERGSYEDAVYRAVHEMMELAVSPGERDTFGNIVVLNCKYGLELIALRYFAGSRPVITGVETRSDYFRGINGEHLQRIADLADTTIYQADDRNPSEVVELTGGPDLIIIRHPFTRYGNVSQGISDLAPWMKYAADRGTPMVATFYDVEADLAGRFRDRAALIAGSDRVRQMEKDKPSASYLDTDSGTVIVPDFHIVRIN